MDIPPRFLLILASHSTLLRASLVTRDLKIAASAQQTFSVNRAEFDPAEVWYKTKRVIAACLDIGRTLSREIAGIALVAGTAETVVWSLEAGETKSRGIVLQNDGPLPDDVEKEGKTSYRGTIAAWLFWNLTGAFDPTKPGKTRARAPFDAELPVLVIVNRQNTRAPDQVLLDTARDTWDEFSGKM